MSDLRNHHTIPGPWTSLAEVRDNHARREVDWFDANAFFATIIESGILDGRFFVTSEQFEASDGSHPFPRAFTIRFVDDAGDISTVGDFQEHSSLYAALSRVESIIDNEEEI